MKLWDKGISIDKKIEQFTVGNDRELDMNIAAYDVIASLAHAKMLAEIHIITSEELKQLEEGLNSLQQQIKEGAFCIETQFEDVHSKVEYLLTEKLGDTGKKNSYSAFKKRSGFGRCAFIFKRCINWN